MFFCALVLLSFSNQSYAADDISYNFEIIGLEDGEYLDFGVQSAKQTKH